MILRPMSYKEARYPSAESEGNKVTSSRSFCDQNGYPRGYEKVVQA